MKIVITGLGGQGVTSLTRLIAAAAHREGKKVVSTETHGMAQRGASVISFIKIGPYMNPLIQEGTADAVFCLNGSETNRALRTMGAGSSLFLNTQAFAPDESARRFVQERDIHVHTVSAKDEAALLGNPRAANLYLLGFALPSCNGLPRLDALRKAVKDYLKPQLQEANLNILQQGYIKGVELHERAPVPRT